MGMENDQLTNFKKKLEEGNLQGLALDIDETLADSNYYWFKSMYDLKPIDGHTLEDLLKKYKFAEEVPGWDTPEFYTHMDGLLHSEEFNENIPLIENSNHVVNDLNKTLPILAYITARPATVRGATERWLKRHGFPDAELITRSHDTKTTELDLVSRNRWKAEILEKLYPHIKGIIDDNKVLVEELNNIGYEGTLYLYGVETEEFKDYKHVVVCPTWNSMLEKIRD